jgi:hypothetical protein
VGDAHPTKLRIAPRDQVGERLDSADEAIVLGMNIPEDSERFTDAINQHGFGLTGAVVEELKRLFDAQKSEWLLEAREFPVHINGENTRIDILLRSSKDVRYRLVGECKRVNPEFHDWLFLDSGIVARNWVERFVVEAVSKLYATYQADGVSLKPMQEGYSHVALAVRKKEGKGGYGDTEPIEKAASQLMRGVNGMAMLLSENPQLMRSDSTVFLLPILFTTAKLFVLKGPLIDVDLLTGDLDKSKCDFEEVPSLYYQYHSSPGIKHSLDAKFQNNELPRLMQSEFVRTIAVVNSAAIGEFMSRFVAEDFDPKTLGM